MFWIPVMFIAACVLAVRALAHQGMEARNKAETAAWERRRDLFRSATSPDRELLFEVSGTTGSISERRRIVREFMSPERGDWDSFAMAGFDPAKMALLASRGKLPPTGYDIQPPYLYSQKEHALLISPPWKIFEMTEKYLLRVEEKLKDNGVDAVLVANYGNSPSGNFQYYPVRDYVAKYGFARDGYVGFGTSFAWAQCVVQEATQP